jgi:hypothetical protein
VAFAAMLTEGGATAMEAMVLVGAGACTVSDELPVMPLRVAVMVAEPAVRAEARPAGVTVATAALDEVHVTDVETFAVELSLYVAVAMSCCVAPTAMLATGGVTARDVRVFAGAGTVTDALPETPLRVAVRVAEPADSPEASPEALIFAIAALEDVQVAEVVTSAVELSL